MGRAKTPYSHSPTTDQATISRQRGPQPVGCLSERQLAKLARPRLDPKLGVCDFGDEFRVARLGLLAEKDLGRPARLGLRLDPDEQEVGAGLGGQAHEDHVRQDGANPSPGSSVRIHGEALRLVLPFEAYRRQLDDCTKSGIEYHLVGVLFRLILTAKSRCAQAAPGAMKSRRSLMVQWASVSREAAIAFNMYGQCDRA